MTITIGDVSFRDFRAGSGATGPGAAFCFKLEASLIVLPEEGLPVLTLGHLGLQAESRSVDEKKLKRVTTEATPSVLRFFLAGGIRDTERWGVVSIV